MRNPRKYPGRSLWSLAEVLVGTWSVSLIARSAFAYLDRKCKSGFRNDDGPAGLDFLDEEEFRKGRAAVSP